MITLIRFVCALAQVGGYLVALLVTVGSIALMMLGEMNGGGFFVIVGSWAISWVWAVAINLVLLTVEAAE